MSTRYAKQLLERREPGALSLHLGYWPDGPDDDLRSAQARLDDLVLDRAHLADGQVVVDVGCGIGGTLLAASRRHRLTLHGVNPDPAQLEVARQAVPEATFHQARASKLPLADASVDRVLSVEAAFHFDSRAHFLAEARRVLRPGGLLVLTDIVPTAKMAALKATGGPAFALEHVVQAGIGPWTDLWGETAGWEDLAPDAVVTDISAATQPSYRCFLDSRERAAPGVSFGQDPMGPAVALLEWLQATGHVRVVLVGAQRQPLVG